MDPDKGLVHLRALAARGIKVRLPDSIFRAVSLPAHMQKSVRVSQRTVGAPGDGGEPPHRDRDALVERFRPGAGPHAALTVAQPLPSGDEVDERHEDGSADDRPQDREGLTADVDQEGLRQLELVSDPGSDPGFL